MTPNTTRPRPSTAPVASPYLTTEELADYLKIPVKTIYRWRTINYGPRAIRCGKHLRYRVADVEKWMDSQAA